MASDDRDLVLAQIEEGKVVPVVGRDLLLRACDFVLAGRAKDEEAR